MPFTKLNLSPSLLQALKKCGYKQPTAIQEQSIPRILAGKDVIAIAQTGTGKTAAFVLPALQLLSQAAKHKLPKVLILAPVRELANQITDAIHKYSSENKINVVSILGGMPYQAQQRQLAKTVDIIVATPGRLIDYIERGSIDLSQIKMLVLDEADRMLDMGFIDDVKLISRHLSDKRQTLLFTATMDKQVTQLAKTILHNPEHIAVEGKSVTLEKIKQSIYIADDIAHKNQLLTHLLTTQSIYKAIIFSATKHHADKLAKQLNGQGHAVDVLHGDIKQHKRNRILEQFRRGKINILVATDVAARGIDISDISHVINYDITRTAEDYVHRIGRTGRAGREGVAISFVLADEAIQLKRIERFINDTIPQESVPGLEPKKRLQASEHKPKKSSRNRNRNRQRTPSAANKNNRSRSSHRKPTDSRQKKPARRNKRPAR